MSPTSRVRLTLAATALVALSGCAEMGGARDPWNAPRYPDRRAPTYDGRSDDYRRTSEYRRVNADAAAYARYVERNLRSGHEHAIRQIVERRALDLLRRTRPRDHARVYPFPRAYNRHTGFWSGVDRDVESRLGSRHRDDYRYLVRYGEARYRDRYRDDRRHDGRDDWRRDRDDDRWGRDDGERGRDGRGWDRGDDRSARPGESLEDWYRRQGRDRP